MACSDFLPSPAFRYFKEMAMRSVVVSWGKRCQQKSSAHRNLGAAALERTLLGGPGRGRLCFGKGTTGYCASPCLLSHCPFLPPGLLSPLIHPLCSEKMLLTGDSDSFV